MSKFIFVVFPDEAKAYDGTRSLAALDSEGSLTLYGMAVVAREKDGKLAIKQSVHGALGIAIGSVVGGLIGLLGGPVGVAIGIGGGAMLGMLNDLTNLGVSGEFLEQVSQDLTPGKAAIVAEVSEEWVTPLNMRMNSLGGVVHRTERAEVEDELTQREFTSVKKEMSQLKSEYEQAKADNKAKLQTRIDQIDAKAKTLASRLQARVLQLKEETEAKLKTLQAQAAKMTGEARTRIEERIAALRTDDERRSAQLKQAWGLAQKAFAV